MASTGMPSRRRAFLILAASGGGAAIKRAPEAINPKGSRLNSRQRISVSGRTGIFSLSTSRPTSAAQAHSRSPWPSRPQSDRAWHELRRSAWQPGPPGPRRSRSLQKARHFRSRPPPSFFSRPFFSRAIRAVPSIAIPLVRRISSPGRIRSGAGNNPGSASPSICPTTIGRSRPG